MRCPLNYATKTVLYCSHYIIYIKDNISAATLVRARWHENVLCALCAERNTASWWSLLPPAAGENDLPITRTLQVKVQLVLAGNSDEVPCYAPRLRLVCRPGKWCSKGGSHMNVTINSQTLNAPNRNNAKARNLCRMDSRSRWRGGTNKRFFFSLFSLRGFLTTFICCCSTSNRNSSLFEYGTLKGYL